MATRQRNGTRKTIALNLRGLLTKRGWSEHALAKHSGVAQKTINNILAERSACTVETAAALAKAFNLTEWHLLIPNLPDELLNSPSLAKIVQDWIHATPEGRDHIESVAKREGQIGGAP
jgi:transcriptional regulator with XRE-family HTH domain